MRTVTVALFLVMHTMRALRFSSSIIGSSYRSRLASLAAQSESDQSPLFRFGVCADIQYVAADDDYNFQKTKVRRYRQSLNIFRNAVDHWHESDISFALLLGDILDGKSNSMKNQQTCLDEVLNICRRGRSSEDSWSSFSYYPTMGNHDYYCYSRSELHAKLFSAIPDTSKDKLYYDFSPHPEWRVVALDAYDVSLIGASSDSHKKLAESILARENPNDLTISGSWFNDLPREKFRYVPYNGAIGASQLDWFRGVLSDAGKLNQRCIVFCHQPVFASDKPQSLLWNAEEVRDVMRAAGNVALWIAGHDHDGQYSKCVDSVHHLIPPAPIECGVGEEAYGVLEVFRDRLQLAWVGREPSRPTVMPWAGTSFMHLP